jgi:hypothetical protein
MAVFQSYFKIITPKPKATDYTKLVQDGISQHYTNAISSVSWYSQIMRGSSSRLQRYSQFEVMDTDADVSRCLNTIAEEVSNDDVKTNLPFIIEYQSEDDEEVSESTVTTLRAAVRQWAKVQDLNNRIFRITRNLIKYGDCFFKKSKDTKRWAYVDPSKIFGIEIDNDGEKVAFHVRGSGKNNVMQYGIKNEQIDVIPADAMVHFTLSDEMGESAPFGDSVLMPIMKVFKQLSALEDSVIIYRLVRAPERRVFYIDMGNIPPQRQKAHLESIKNELRQRRMPNTADNKEVIDGTFNPQCLDMNTKIPLLDGRTLTITELELEHKDGKQNWAYSCNPTTGEIVPGLISWAGKTRLNAEVVKITLDNGQELICTPDHKIVASKLGFVEAQHLIEGQKLIPFNKINNDLLIDRVVTKIEKISNMDTGCITIDKDEIYHNYHTFAIEGGIFVKNSISEDFFFGQNAQGRGSRVEVLPGGENLGELHELMFFRRKIFAGLCVPSSYISSYDQQQQPAQYNDGKMGVAYIEELRFANYVRRIQNKVEQVMDREFKLYLKAIGLNIDDWLFVLRLPEPQNFSVYRQLALDADFINAYKSIEDSKIISERYKLKRYLGWTEDELQLNERMLKQELELEDNINISDLKQIYDPVQRDARKAVKLKPTVDENPTSAAAPEEGEDELGSMGDMGGAPEEAGIPGI